METDYEKILHTAMNLFMINGYRNTTTSLIAQASGISESTICQLFGDENGLIQKLFLLVSPNLKDDLALKKSKHSKYLGMSTYNGNKPEVLRKNNLRLVLKKFIETDKLSILDLLQMIDLSKTTMMKLVNQLIKDNLVIEMGINTSEKRGRPAAYYCLNTDYGYGISIQFFPTELSCAITNLKSEILYTHLESINSEITFKDSISLIGKSIEEVIKQQNISMDKILGICIASAGPINYMEGSVKFSPRFKNWPINAEIKKEVRKYIPENIDLIINNERIFQSLGEQFFGKALGQSNVLVLEAGDKMSAGVIVNNQLLVGTNSLAGEIGHMVLDTNSDVQCVCGAYGCFRALVSTERAISLCKKNITRYGGTILDNKFNTLTLENILYAAKQQDKLAQFVVNDLAKWFGLALSNLMLIYDPDIIVIQGVYIQAGLEFLDLIKYYMGKSHFLLLKSANITLEYSNLGKTAGILGGSRLITNKLVENYFSHQVSSL